MINHKSGGKYTAAPPLRLIRGTLLLLVFITALLLLSNRRECSVLAVSPTPTPNGMGMPQQGMGMPQQGMGMPQQGMQGPQQGMMPQQGMQGPQQGMGMPQQQQDGTGGMMNSSSLSNGMIKKDSINFKYEDELRALHQDISFMAKNKKFKLSDVQKKKLRMLLQQLSIKIEAIDSMESSMNSVYNKSQKYLIINNPVNGCYYIPMLADNTGRSRISEDEVLTEVIRLLGKKCTP